MNREMTTGELLAWRRSLTDEQRQRFLAAMWPKVRKLRELSGPEPTEEEWAEIDVWYRDRMSSAATNRS